MRIGEAVVGVGKGRRSSIHDERAQGVVEFAFMVAVLMLLFLGVVDFARFAYYQSAIDNATRVGAESASNHCPSVHNCFLTGATPDDYIVQATVCEATPYVSLQLVNPIASCKPCGPTWTSCTDPCGSSACQLCPSQQQDVCIANDTSSSGCSASHPCVTVTSGYKFKPISFYLDWLFSPQSCWTGDDQSANDHTLCATSEGRVS